MKFLKNMQKKTSICGIMGHPILSRSFVAHLCFDILRLINVPKISFHTSQSYISRGCLTIFDLFIYSIFTYLLCSEVYFFRKYRTWFMVTLTAAHYIPQIHVFRVLRFYFFQSLRHTLFKLTYCPRFTIKASIMTMIFLFMMHHDGFWLICLSALLTVRGVRLGHGGKLTETNIGS